MGRRSNGTLNSEAQSAVVEAYKAIANAKNEHIKDLRVLIDRQSEFVERQEALQRMVLEHYFYRPTITQAGLAGAPARGPMKPAIPVEMMSEVTQFDVDADDAQMKQQSKEYADAVQEFQSIATEHEEDRARGFRAKRPSAEEVTEAGEASE